MDFRRIVWIKRFAYQGSAVKSGEGYQCTHLYILKSNDSIYWEYHTEDNSKLGRVSKTSEYNATCTICVCRERDFSKFTMIHLWKRMLTLVELVSLQAQ